MLTIILKFAEVGGRALFVVFSTFTLGLVEAGQFGLVVTIQGLASFVFGYERQLDIQRRVVGKSDSIFDQIAARSFALFATNYIIAAPLFGLLLIYLAQISIELAVICVAIAICEQLMNFAYHLAIVSPRFRSVLAITTAKNIVIAAVVIISGLSGAELTLGFVLKVWASTSVLGLLIILSIWLKTKNPRPKTYESIAAGIAPWNLRGSLQRQYKASLMHFLLGVVAVLTLQVDRLLVGALVSLEVTGIFFRHVMLVSMLYQVFNIAFHNRILPKVFVAGKEKDPDLLKPIVRREYWNVLVFWLAAFLCLILANEIDGGSFAEKFNLVPHYFLGLLIMSAIRARADLNALMYNALHKEKLVFQIQLISFAIGLPILSFFTIKLEIAGIIIAGCINASIYFLLSAYNFNKMNLVNQNG